MTRRLPASAHRVKLGGADPHTVASYVNEISLLQRLRSYEHIVTLFDAYVDRFHGYIYMVRGRRPAPWTRVRLTWQGIAPVLPQVMECGEVDLARLLQKRQGRQMDENFVRYFWQQVCGSQWCVSCDGTSLC